MVINYDIEKIQKFLLDFYKITGLTISVWDTDINQLAYEPQKMSEFCKLIKGSPLGKKRCLCSDRKIISDCNQKKCATTHKCHAGLVDTAVPILYGEQVLGFIMFGQVKDKDFPEITKKEIDKLSRELKIPQKKLNDSYNKLAGFDADIIESASNILNSALLSLYLNNYISFTENELVTAIHTYINSNIQSPISVSNICEEFSIAKNRLYTLWRKWFGLTVGDYILNIRMRRAKNLLVNEDMKIKDVCVEVGIPDYNYFSKVFKRFYGVSPKEYKKGYPILSAKNNISE